MTHSFSKLELLLASKYFITRNIFTIDGYCVYIEIFCRLNAVTFLLYIPSSFNIKPEKDSVYKLRYVDIEDSNNILSKYTEEPDNSDIKNDYDEAPILSSTENQDLEKSLNENYNKEILLKDLNKEDKESLKDIFRQLNRFKFCVQNIKYKFVILHKNYLSAIKRDDIIECYYINNFPHSNRKLYVSIDLKSLYEKLDTVHIDIKIVKDSIYKILNQNHIKHSKILHNMLEKKDKLIYCSELVHKKKLYYDQYINELENITFKLQENETLLIKEKSKYNTVSESGIKGVYTDIQDSHNIFNINSKLQKNQELKEELLEDIVNVRNEQENIILSIDKILFDNSIMLNEIIKNFDIIIKILE